MGSPSGILYPKISRPMKQLGFVDFGYPKTKIGFPDKAANFVVDFGLACFRKHGIFLHDWQICSRDVG